MAEFKPEKCMNCRTGDARWIVGMLRWQTFWEVRPDDQALEISGRCPRCKLAGKPGEVHDCKYREQPVVLLCDVCKKQAVRPWGREREKIAEVLGPYR